MFRNYIPSGYKTTCCPPFLLVIWFKVKIRDHAHGNLFL